MGKTHLLIAYVYKLHFFSVSLVTEPLYLSIYVHVAHVYF